MQTQTLPVAEPSALLEAARGLGATRGDAVGVLVAEGGAPDLEAIVARLGELDVPFFGGLFPALLAAGKCHQQGAIVFRVPVLGEPAVLTRLDEPPIGLPVLAAVDAEAAKPTALVLVDGLSPHVGRLLDGLYDHWGNRVRVWGGGAGSMQFTPRPCVFVREGLFASAAVVVLSSLDASLGVHHGWSVLTGPFVATRTRGNVVLELNWQPAFDVYRGAVEPDAGRPIDPDAFYQVAANYPFGLQREGEELVVRDPVSLSSDGSLVCVGEVPENAVLFVLRGDPAALTAGARLAAQEAVAGAAAGASGCLVADCISRFLNLGGRFDTELAAIDEGLAGLGEGVVPFGPLTLGEIASRGEGHLEFFNKTSVVAVLRDAGV